MYIHTHLKSDCCGCMACASVCGRNAIKMKRDKCGFLYPAVEPEKCVHCGLCEKVCPMEESYVGQAAEPGLYALRNRDKNVLEKSSSGGMFTLLAGWIFGQGGVIYGVAFDSDFSVRHMRAESMDEAAAFRTSKYVESDISGVYEPLVKDLREGRTVLFTGTPCQVSGMKKFLAARHVDTAKLYTCDNICHGVPSRKLWADYLEILRTRYARPENPITAVNMRSKRFSWKKQVLDIQLKDGSLDLAAEEFSFNRFFLSLYGNRPSCFHCRYTSYKRPGDFSLGDFWNVENAGVTFDVEGGVNLVLVNTEKGRKLFESLKGSADYQPVSKKDSWQPHLEYSAKAPGKQKEFWQEYLAAGESPKNREAILRKYLRGSLVTRIIRRVTPLLRKTGLYGAAGALYKAVFVRQAKPAKKTPD